MTGPADICDASATDAARVTGIPVSVLKAITRTETGRSRAGRLQPWPWTVNMEGKGYWFDDEARARAFAQQEYERGARSFDIGCFQINFKWHGTAFGSIDEMFDPGANALYAARFLLSLYEETGSWGRAAGAYHSRTQNFAEKYQARFERIRSALQDREGTERPSDVQQVTAPQLASLTTAEGVALTRVNTYPLLRSGNAQGLGSLVPIENTVLPGFFKSLSQPVVTN